MAFEVELKARIPSISWLENNLANTFNISEGRRYVKRDIYFASPETPEITEFRLRNDGNEFIVTRKLKTIENGIEVSDEIEFSVGNPENFVRFAWESGYIETIRKVKRGTAYSLGDLLVEVSEVENLGSYVELEILLDNPAPVAVEEAKGRLRQTLTKLGLSSSDIEEKPYTVMLREQIQGNAGLSPLK